MATITGSTFVNTKEVQFNGSSQYAYMDNPSFGSHTQGFLAAWITWSSLLGGVGSKWFAGFGRNDAQNQVIGMAMRRNSSLTIAPTWRNQPIPEVIGRTFNGGPANGVYGEHIFTLDRTLVVMESNGSAWKIYVNGTDVTGAAWMGTPANTGAWFGNITGSSRRFTLGCAWLANSPYNSADCRLDEVLIGSRPLTSGEHTELFNGGVSRNPHRLSFIDDCTSWYRCGDSRDNSSTIYDELGSNDLTLVGSPSYQIA